MVFFPVSPVRKFGFNRPLGLFIDEIGGHIVKQSLTPEDYESFRQYASNREDARQLLAWFDNFKDLIESEVLQTWNEIEDGPFPGMEKGYAREMARLRTTRVALALPPDLRGDQSVPESLSDAVHTLDGWTRIGRMRNRHP
jgi:hypothetical protein